MKSSQFPSLQTRTKYLETGQFIPENNIVSGIKVHRNRIYLTVPRLRSGVPSTLNYINLNSLSRESNGRLGWESNKSPQLIPYPSWKMQTLGNCNALQNVQSMEIDRWGRMWIIDTGRERVLEEADSSSSCPAKLIIIELATNRIIHRHQFPDDVVHPKTNFLNDIVVECKTDEWSCWAYITDSLDAKLVMYCLEEDRSWFVQHSVSMEADPKATQMNILGTQYNFSFAINGIALSPRRIANHDRIYYHPLSSFSIYSVLTSTLKRAFRTGQTVLSDDDVDCHLKHGSSQSDGIIMDSNGLLYSTVLQNNAVTYFNISDVIKARNGNRNHLFTKRR